MEKLVVLLLLFVCVFSTGEWQEVAKDSEKVKDLAFFATKRISDGINSRNHQKVIEVLKAERQLVAGFKYNLTISIGETTCPKNKVSFENAQNCDLQETEILQTCVVIMWEQPWRNFIDVLDFHCSNTPKAAKVYS